jgi:hypothetical protein
MNNNLEFENEDPSPDSIEDNHPRTNYGAGYSINKKPKLEDFYDTSDPRGCSSSEYDDYQKALDDYLKENKI